MLVCPLEPEQILQLKDFITACQAQPEIMHHPHLSFFKDYIESLGAVVPPLKEFTFETTGESGSSSTARAQEPAADESDAESVVELDMSGVTVSEPADERHEMGDPAKECTDEERDLSDEKRAEAMRAFSDHQLDKALNLYTEAITLNPLSALLFAKRGQVYLKLNKLHDCIVDCTHALSLNCDSAAAYKFRGRAHSLLGQFEEANQDLCESLKIDYDDQTNEWLQAVKPNAEKLRHHKLIHQRHTEEKQHREKVRRAREAQEAHAAAAREAREAGGEAFGFRGNPFGAGGTPWGAPFGAGAQRAAPGGFDPSNLAGLLMDPEIMAAFQEPEVAAAFSDVSSNPANFAKYQNNPKVAAVIEKLQAKFAASGGAGGLPRGFPSFGGGAGGGGAGGGGAEGGAGGGGAEGGAGGGAPRSAGDDDVGLD